MKLETSEFKLIISGREKEILRAILSKTTGNFLEEVAESNQFDLEDVTSVVHKFLNILKKWY